jgi:WD40 repeat protein/uncharacterized caspase-like protein
MKPLTSRLAVLAALIITASSHCAQDLRLVLPIGHIRSVGSAHFSPDGKTIITASNDNKANIWSTESGHELHSLDGHSDAVSSAQFSPDGKVILTASWDFTSKIWNAETGKEIHYLEGHSNVIHSAQFSPDGRTIVTASWDNTAKVWDSNTGKEIRSLTGHTGAVNLAAFSPDGKTIVTASNDKTAKIWNSLTGQELHNLEGHSDWVLSANFSPDGKSIITISQDNTAKIWSVETGREILSLEKHINWINSAAFSPDGKTIVTASSDKTAKVWNAKTGQEIHTLSGHMSAIYSAQFSPDGKTIVTASDDKSVKIWSIETGQVIHSLEKHVDRVNSAQFSPDGKTLVTSSWDNSAILWNAASGKEMYSLVGHSDSVNSAQFSPDGKTIVTASNDHSVIIWNVESGKHLISLEGSFKSANSADFNPNSQSIVAASMGNSAIIWNTELGQQIISLEGHSDEVCSVQFSPDGKSLITASWDKTAKIWNTETGQELFSLEGHTRVVNSAQFSPDGKTVVTASWDNTAKIWSIDTGKELHSLIGHSYWVRSAQFSPDGKTIVTASNDNKAKVWSVETGEELLTFENHEDWITEAKFSPDGKTIVTASWDNTAKIWDAETGHELHNLQGHADGLKSARFSPDGATIATSSWDNTTKIWDAETGTLLYTRLMLRDGGWLAWDPEYRFDGSSNAIDLLHFACGLEVIELSQAKEPLYVPNLVARIMGGEDLSSKPTLESLDLCGRTPIVTPLPGDGRGWQFDLEPRKGGLQYCEVYIDGVRRFDVPVAELELQANGHYLLSVSNEQVAEYAAASETEIVVIAHSEDKLTSRGGNTWVSVSAPRGNQDEAERAFYGLFIGINDYKGKDLRLNYAAADARELGQVIEAAAVGLFGQENTHVTTLLSDNNRGDVVNPPEKQRVLAELASIAERSNAHDILFVHLAGHGTVNEHGEFVFLTSEASSLEDGQYTGVTMQEMSDALMGIKASNRVFIFDACHSGEAMQDALEEGQMAIAFTARNTVSQEEDIARGKQLERLGDKANMTMLSASASDQAAFELPEIGHGLLTYALLNAIQAHSDILDEGRFLEVKPWIFQAERTVNSRSEGPNRQQAQSHTPHNYPIGEITPDVRGLIQIDEKPVIKSISLRNKIKGIDDLGLGEKIQNNLKSGAPRGGVTLFIPDSPTGIGIEGKYSPLEDGRLRVYCEFFTASQFLGEAEWIDEPEADWHQLISAWILENVGD